MADIDPTILEAFDGDEAAAQRYLAKYGGKKATPKAEPAPRPASPMTRAARPKVVEAPPKPAPAPAPAPVGDGEDMAIAGAPVGSYGTGGLRHQLEDLDAQERAPFTAAAEGRIKIGQARQAELGNMVRAASSVPDTVASLRAKNEQRLRDQAVLEQLRLQNEHITKLATEPGSHAKEIRQARRESLASGVAPGPAPIPARTAPPVTTPPSPGFTPTQTFEVGETAAKAPPTSAQAARRALVGAGLTVDEVRDFTDAEAIEAAKEL